MCGFFDSRRIGKNFDRLAELLASDHPVPAIRFYKMHATLIEAVHNFYSDESMADTLLSQTNTFAIDIFMNDGSSVDFRNCFWAPVQTKEAQDFITLLERGWNLIHDSLQRCSTIDIPLKYTEEDLFIYEDMIWYDKHGNPLNKGSN